MSAGGMALLLESIAIAALRLNAERPSPRNAGRESTDLRSSAKVSLASLLLLMPARPGQEPVLTIAPRRLGPPKATPLWRGRRLSPGGEALITPSSRPFKDKGITNRNASLQLPGRTCAFAMAGIAKL
jgi:hypothetical protein